MPSMVTVWVVAFRRSPAVRARVYIRLSSTANRAMRRSASTPAGRSDDHRHPPRLCFSIDNPDSEPFRASDELLCQMSSAESAKPRMGGMSDDDSTALPVAGQQQHLVGDGPDIEGRRHAGMNSRYGDTCPLKRRLSRAQDPIGLRISDGHPPTLRRAQIG